jgi:EpsI family protein
VFCLPATGWEIAPLHRHTLEAPNTAYGSFKVNRATIRKGLQQQLVYYWFEGRGKRETNDIIAKFTVLLDALKTGRTDGALVRFITPIENGDVAAAEARLNRFIETALPNLPDFVPL